MLPQELRWPEFRTAPSHPEVEKILMTYQVLGYPSIQKLSVLQEMSIRQIWGNLNSIDEETLIRGMMELDQMAMEEQKPDAS